MLSCMLVVCLILPFLFDLHAKLVVKKQITSSGNQSNTTTPNTLELKKSPDPTFDLALITAQAFVREVWFAKDQLIVITQYRHNMTKAYITWQYNSTIISQSQRSYSQSTSLEVQLHLRAHPAMYYFLPYSSECAYRNSLGPRKMHRHRPPPALLAQRRTL